MFNLSGWGFPLSWSLWLSSGAHGFCQTGIQRRAEFTWILVRAGQKPPLMPTWCTSQEEHFDM